LLPLWLRRPDSKRKAVGYYWLLLLVAAVDVVAEMIADETATDWGCRRIVLLQVAVPRKVELVVDDRYSHIHNRDFRHQDLLRTDCCTQNCSNLP
jgi:hypothetical protein